MMKRGLKSKSSFQSDKKSKKPLAAPFKVASTFALSHNFSGLLVKPSMRTKQNYSLSTSSIWRAVHTVRCTQSLEKETIDPVRRNLSEKALRLKEKREQQQKRYKKMVTIIRRKCQSPTPWKKQEFGEAKNVIQAWLDERKLQQNRYQSRLHKFNL